MGQLSQMATWLQSSTDHCPVPSDRVVQIIEEIALTTPSSYNTQTGRITVHLGQEHRKLWRLVQDKVLPVIKEHAGEDVANMLNQKFELYSSESCFKAV
jgi:predicted oxidoreductase (fatty acid repression mutant protein)